MCKIPKEVLEIDQEYNYITTLFHLVNVDSVGPIFVQQMIIEIDFIASTGVLKVSCRAVPNTVR